MSAIETKECLVLRCQLDGTVEVVMRDDLSCLQSVHTPLSFVSLFDGVQQQKARQFLHELQQHKIVVDWELQVACATESIALNFFGGVIDDKILIFGGGGGQSVVSYDLFQELMKISNEQVNQIRGISKQTYEPVRLNEQALFEDLTKLNNELVSVQRKLSKNNKLLEDTNQQLQTEIRQRQQIEAALCESREQYRILVDNIDVGVIFVDCDFQIIRANNAQGRLFNFDPIDLVGRKCYEVFQQRDSCCDTCTGYQCVQSRQVAERELDMVLPNGTLMNFWIRAFPITDGDTQELIGFIEVFQDITERKKIEEERRRLQARIQSAQKMESLSVLAGGIAHDFNNLLVGILGNTDLLEEDLNSQGIETDLLDEIKFSAKRMAELSHQMLIYSGKGRHVFNQTSLSHELQGMQSLLYSSFKEQVPIQYNLDLELPQILVDRAQFRQVVIALITNACEAIEDIDEGRVTISTGTIFAERALLQKTIPDPDLPAGKYVYLKVSDNGVGIEPENLRKIFEPFYTTKFFGRGLGLSALLGVVRAHHGTVLVESERNHETSLMVLFPIHHPQEHSPPTHSPSSTGDA